MKTLFILTFVMLNECICLHCQLQPSLHNMCVIGLHLLLSQFQLEHVKTLLSIYLFMLYKLRSQICYNVIVAYFTNLGLHSMWHDKQNCNSDLLVFLPWLESESDSFLSR